MTSESSIPHDSSVISTELLPSHENNNLHNAIDTLINSPLCLAVFENEIVIDNKKFSLKHLHLDSETEYEYRLTGSEIIPISLALKEGLALKKNADLIDSYQAVVIGCIETNDSLQLVTVGGNFGMHNLLMGAMATAGVNLSFIQEICDIAGITIPLYNRLFQMLIRLEFISKDMGSRYENSYDLWVNEDNSNLDFYEQDKKIKLYEPQLRIIGLAVNELFQKIKMTRQVKDDTIPILFTSAYKISVRLKRKKEIISTAT